MQQTGLNGIESDVAQVEISLHRSLKVYLLTMFVLLTSNLCLYTSGFVSVLVPPIMVPDIDSKKFL